MVTGWFPDAGASAQDLSHTRQALFTKAPGSSALEAPACAALNPNPASSGCQARTTTPSFLERLLITAAEQDPHVEVGVPSAPQSGPCRKESACTAPRGAKEEGKQEVKVAGWHNPEGAATTGFCLGSSCERKASDLNEKTHFHPAIVQAPCFPPHT